MSAKQAVHTASVHSQSSVKKKSNLHKERVVSHSGSAIRGTTKTHGNRAVLGNLLLREVHCTNSLTSRQQVVSEFRQEPRRPSTSSENNEIGIE